MAPGPMGLSVTDHSYIDIISVLLKVSGVVQPAPSPSYCGAASRNLASLREYCLTMYTSFPKSLSMLLNSSI